MPGDDRLEAVVEVDRGPDRVVGDPPAELAETRDRALAFGRAEVVEDSSASSGTRWTRPLPRPRPRRARRRTRARGRRRDGGRGRPAREPRRTPRTGSRRFSRLRAARRSGRVRTRRSSSLPPVRRGTVERAPFAVESASVPNGRDPGKAPPWVGKPTRHPQGKLYGFRRLVSVPTLERFLHSGGVQPERRGDGSAGREGPKTLGRVRRRHAGKCHRAAEAHARSTGSTSTSISRAAASARSRASRFVSPTAITYPRRSPSSRTGRITSPSTR